MGGKSMRQHLLDIFTAAARAVEAGAIQNAVVDTTYEDGFVAADGRQYRVTVTVSVEPVDAGARIPRVAVAA